MIDKGHGQIWWADLDKVRPVLVLTRSTVAPSSPGLWLPRSPRWSGIYPSRYELGADEGVADGSVVNFDNVQLVPVSVLLHPAGALSELRWEECCRAMANVMAC